MAKFFLVACSVLVVILPAIGQSRSNPTRARALAQLKGCSNRPVALGCDENTAIYLIRLYQRGDSSLLHPLLDAGRRSDGALSAALADFYSEVLWKSPERFLRALATRPPKEQYDLARLAGGTDGSGMPDKMLEDVRKSLKRVVVGRRGTLVVVARRVLIAVDEANAAVRRS